MFRGMTGLSCVNGGVPATTCSVWSKARVCPLLGTVARSISLHSRVFPRFWHMFRCFESFPELCHLSEDYAPQG